MIQQLNPKKCAYEFLVDFLIENHDWDFYFTEKNERTYITDLQSFKKLLKQSYHVYVYEENGDCEGIILLWKSFGGDKKRDYVKINALNGNVAEKLLTVLLWNTKKDLCIKLRKDNKFLQIFKQKGFRFKAGRGIQILLERRKKYGSYFNNSRNSC